MSVVLACGRSSVWGRRRRLRDARERLFLTLFFHYGAGALFAYFIHPPLAYQSPDRMAFTGDSLLFHWINKLGSRKSSWNALKLESGCACMPVGRYVAAANGL